VAGDCRRGPNEEMHDTYFSANIILVRNKEEIGGPCGTCGGEESCIQGFDGETGGKETT